MASGTKKVKIICVLCKLFKENNHNYISLLLLELIEMKLYLKGKVKRVFRETKCTLRKKKGGAT